MWSTIVLESQLVTYVDVYLNVTSLLAPKFPDKTKAHTIFLSMTVLKGILYS